MLPLMVVCTRALAHARVNTAFRFLSLGFCDLPPSHNLAAELEKRGLKRGVGWSVGCVLLGMRSRLRNTDKRCVHPVRLCWHHASKCPCAGSGRPSSIVEGICSSLAENLLHVTLLAVSEIMIRSPMPHSETITVR